MPIDFSKRIKGPRVPKKVYKTLKGFRTNCVSKMTSEVDLQWEVVKTGEDRWAFKILNGPTGYECVEIAGGFKERISSGEGSWIACMGTDGRWDRLEIPFINIHQAIFKDEHPKA